MSDRELVERIAQTTGLPPNVAERVVDDVLAWHCESVEDYVRRRHARLQLFGTRNAEAFRTIAEELRRRPFAAPELSERQLRRIVYG